MSDNQFKKPFGVTKDMSLADQGLYYKGANDFRVFVLYRLIEELTTNVHWSEDMVFELANRIGLSREPYFILGEQETPPTE